MMQLRTAASRGHSRFPWLDSFHTFSFGDYYDPAHMGYSVLRVINDDTVAPGMGFGRHGHRDMEIITYVLAGALEHRDSLGNGAIIRAGEVQCMSAGTGIVHSEFNASRDEAVHFLQIWIEPHTRGGEPRYAQAKFSTQSIPGSLIALAAGDGRNGALPIKQNAALHLARPTAEHTVTYRPEKGRHIYLHVAKGSTEISGIELSAGDGLMVEDCETMALTSTRDGEVLLFDLP